MARRVRMFTLAVIAFLAGGVFMETAGAQSDPPSLDQTGQTTFQGQLRPYRIRNLPVSSFPELPGAIASALTSRGCIIPQTYEARRPENVIHASFERPGSSDWAVLCSAHDRVALLVFFASGSSDAPAVLNTRSCLLMLEPRNGSSELGFDWGIDPASPRRVHDAQASMPHRPPPPDHDALAETMIDQGTIYHLYRNGAWETVPTE